jgi:acyl-CoA thioester hydrolase
VKNGHALTEIADRTTHAVEGQERQDGSAFHWQAPVYFDDLDAMGMLHNARYFSLTDRTISAFFESRGRRWESDPRLNPDQHWAVREQHLAYSTPFRGVGLLDVELSVERLGVTSATYRVRFSSNGREHASGSRTVIKIDPDTGRPAAWTARTRDDLTAISVA